MKHSDRKKLSSMVCASILSVSSFIGCVYGPEPTDELKAAYAIDLEQIDSDETAMPEPDCICNQ